MTRTSLDPAHPCEKPPRISLAMFVKDEAATLEGAIRSAWDACDELVIGVDRTSTDESLSIARRLAAEKPGCCFEFDWPDDFAAARNTVLDRCTGDFALILDGHEFVEDCGQIRRVAEALAHSDAVTPEGVSVREAPFASFVLVMDDHEGGDLLMQPRLLRLGASPRPRYESAVHNRLNVGDGAGLGFEEVRIRHRRTRENRLARARQRYEMIPRKFGPLASSPDPRLRRKARYYLGVHYLTDAPETGAIPDYGRALEHLDAFVREVGLHDTEGYLAGYLAWQAHYLAEQAGMASAATEDSAERRAWELVHARQDMPHGFLALHRMSFDAWQDATEADRDRAEGLLARAEWACRAATGHPFRVGPLAQAPALYTWVPLANLVPVYQAQGRLHDAVLAARAALQHDGLPDTKRAELCAHVTLMEQELQAAVSPEPVAGSRPSIAVFDKLGSFSAPLVRELREAGYDVCTFEAFDPRVMHAVDVAYFDWCDDLLVDATRRQPWRARIVARVQGYEAMASEWLARINWAQVGALALSAEHQRWQLAEHGAVTPERVRMEVIPNGVDPGAWRFSADRRPERIAVVGYLNIKKGINLALAAAAHLEPYGFAFHFAGAFQDARTELHFRNAVADWGLRNVHFHGWQADLDAWLDEVDPAWALCASLLEGHPFNVLECAAKGIQPLVHRYPGAERQWPAAWLWRAPSDLFDRRGTGRLAHAPRECAHACRAFVTETYPQRRQLRALRGLIEECAHAGLRRHVRLPAEPVLRAFAAA